MIIPLSSHVTITSVLPVGMVSDDIETTLLLCTKKSADAIINPVLRSNSRIHTLPSIWPASSILYII